MPRALTRRQAVVAATTALLLAGSRRATAQMLTGDHPETSENWLKVRVALFQQRPIGAAADSLLRLDAPHRALDAAVVPLAVGAAAPGTGGARIRTLWLVIDNNPSPVAARFDFLARSGRADIETRVRIDSYSFVRAIAETADGQLHMAVRFVKASGGCSAPPGKDAAAALATLGKMRLRVEGDVLPGRPMQAQLMVSHPNDTGMVTDVETRATAPAYFVREVEVSYAGEPVLTADLDFSISENPNLRFWFVPGGDGELRAVVVDSKGLRFESGVRVLAAG